MTLKSRFLIGNMLLLLVLGSLLYFALELSSRQDSIFQVASHANGMKSSLLSMRRHEKNYLARQDKKYLKAFDQSLILFQENHQAVSTDKIGQQLNAELTQLERDIQQYRSYFFKIIDKSQQAGTTPKEGLFKSFLDAAKQTEITLQAESDMLGSNLILQMRKSETDFLLQNDPEDLERFQQRYKAFVSIGSSDDAALQLEKYYQSFSQYIELKKQIGLDETNGIRGQMRKQAHAAEKSLTTMIDFIDQYEKKTSQGNQQLIWAILLIAIIGGLFLVTFNVLLMRHAVISLRDLGTVMQQAAINRDLSLRHPAAGRDEITQIGAAFNSMLDSFEQTLLEINTAVPGFCGDAQKMSQIADDNFQQMQHQQTEIEQVASAMQQMSSTSHEMADNAAQAEHATKEARSEAEQGQQIVDSTIGRINGLAKEIESAAAVIETLQDQSQSIGKILEVISGIAEQTNLLALNAAIEAARAGDQGRGFAVVADEVRSLAGRTQQSTSEIQNMINQLQQGSTEAVSAMQSSQQQAGISVESAAETGQSLERIAHTVGLIADQNALIATATQQQSSVSGDMSRNLGNIAQMSQKTGEVSHQTTSDAKTLVGHLQQLSLLVNKFKINK